MATSQNNLLSSMRFRIWHLLVLMVFVACWVPISKWLLALEASDHPAIPQSSFVVVCFYLGSITFVGVPFVIIAWFFKCWLWTGKPLNDRERHDDSESLLK